MQQPSADNYSWIDHSLLHHSGDTLSLWGEQGEMAGSWMSQTPGFCEIGESGDLLPARLGDDAVVSGVLLFSAFLVVFLAAGSWRYFALAFKDFFYVRERENLFAERDDTEMRGRWLMVGLFHVLSGIFLFQYLFPVELFASSPAFMRLSILLCVACVALGYSVFFFFFRFVNYLFFDVGKNKRWTDSFLLLTMLSAFLMVPLLLLSVFANLAPSVCFVSVLIIALIAQFLLFYRTFCVFFRGFLGLVHLILYFCTLEFLPAMMMWRGMLWVSTQLTTIYL